MNKPVFQGNNVNSADSDQGIKTVIYHVFGIVQGVGFRPFVYKLAKLSGLTGTVQNLSGAVKIIACGTQKQLDAFVEKLQTEKPPLAKISKIEIDNNLNQFSVYSNFEIIESQSLKRETKSLPADSATCLDCVQELFDRQNRRYRYPFTNCTNCGPRFTIIHSLPYDRNLTTMKDFPMCKLCLAEYNDPLNRRFHAQPNACADCGPQLSFFEVLPSNKIISTDNEQTLALAVKALQEGKILALKGIGGYHLVCDARQSQSVKELRKRKQRYGKPLAIMVKNIEAACKLACLSQKEKDILLSPEHPIVLLSIKNPSTLPFEVTNGLSEIGLFLPYTPLHHLLLSDFNGPLIMTSGNLSDEPIAIKDKEALLRLSKIADVLVTHNREIETRYDDSVLRLSAGAPRMMRRARGYAPLPLYLPWQTNKTVLAFGAHLKNTFCFLRKNEAYLSQHIGDLDNLETKEHWLACLDKFEKLFDMQPEIIACDLHPDYLSTQLAHSFAKRLNIPLVNVQHHHAHAVAVMAEYGLKGPVLAVSFDGTGYGLDESVWGGEFLLAHLNGFRRVASFEPVRMPGSSAAIHQPWRMLCAYLLKATNSSQEVKKTFARLSVKNISQKEIDVVLQMAQSGFNSPWTSSCGRLFDAVSCLLGISEIPLYEGQAAMELESMAKTFARNCNNQDASLEEIASNVLDGEETSCHLPLIPAIHNDDFILQPVATLVKYLSDSLNAGKDPGELALAFHLWLANTIVDICKELRQKLEVNSVVLCGGVFQNALLLTLTNQLLQEQKFAVSLPEKAPCNDGSISLGQAVAAAAILNNLQG